MLDTVTYQSPDVVKFTQSMVNVNINAEKDTVTAQKYGVAGYPTIVLAKSDGSEVDRIYGYADPADFIQTMTDYLADKNTLADYLRRVEAEPTMNLYYMIGEKYVGRKKYGDAETYFRKILQNDPSNKEGYSDSALYSLGEMKTRAKEFMVAQETYDRFLATYPESDLADDAFYGKAVAMRREEKFDDAIAQFKKFLEVYPSSDLVPDVEIYIAFCNDKKGDKEKALELYRKFQVDHPGSSDSSWVEEQIDKILNPPASEGEE